MSDLLSEKRRRDIQRVSKEILDALADRQEWYTAKEAAVYLRMSENEFRRLVKDEPDIHEYKISERRIRFNRQDLDDWMHTR